jgi:hypothetical protein
MGLIRLVTFLLIILMACGSLCKAQGDSTIESLQQLPLKYINQLDNKIDKYSNRISSKTEKTLTKLAKWENKIHSLLQKASPETAERLFGNNQTTFTTLLQKIQEGKSIAENYQTKYDSYRDKLTTNLKYLQQQKDNVKGKLVKPVTEASQKLSKLEDNVKNSEALEQFIKERKKLLLDQCFLYIGKNKYLQKISQENFYYIETLRNYKELFHDSKKAEQTALAILNKIPAFSKYMQENSMLASLFGSPSAISTPANLAGLQTRASVQGLIQQQIAAAGPNAIANFQQNLQTAQSQLSRLKDKVLKAGGNSSDMEIPDFKPKETKSRTFKQRLVFGTNIQTQKATNYFPSRSDLGLSLGYKANDKSLIGIGASISLGLGQGWNNIRLSSQGIGLRSFIDYKLKKQFFVSGGFEMNYLTGFTNVQQLQPFNTWQQSGLVGITKKIAVKTKWFKGTNLQLLYDLLANQNPGISKPLVFRVGYNF